MTRAVFAGSCWVTQEAAPVASSAFPVAPPQSLRSVNVVPPSVEYWNWTFPVRIPLPPEAGTDTPRVTDWLTVKLPAGATVSTGFPGLTAMGCGLIRFATTVTFDAATGAAIFPLGVARLAGPVLELMATSADGLPATGTVNAD